MVIRRSFEAFSAAAWGRLDRCVFRRRRSSLSPLATRRDGGIGHFFRAKARSKSGNGLQALRGHHTRHYFCESPPGLLACRSSSSRTEGPEGPDSHPQWRRISDGVGRISDAQLQARCWQVLREREDSGQMTRKINSYTIRSRPRPQPISRESSSSLYAAVG